MRNKRLAWNTLSGLILQGTTIICGFILPRAILNRFGSEINGLTNSIAQFLQMIAFLELGVGSVMQSALYKPLADRNEDRISEVVTSGSRFYRKLGGMLVAYVVGLIIFFPLFVDRKYGFVFDATLILAMSISHFTRYYFGLVDSLLLKADQKAYIINTINTVTLIINTACCYCLLQIGCSIQVVKFTTAGIFLLRPVLVRCYVRRNYRIDRKRTYEKDPITQKWNGIAQHVAAIVLDGTDMVVLSVFSDMYAVSVYSVYLIVVSGIKSLVLSCYHGISPLLGELWAKREKAKLDRYFGFTEWFVHTVVLFAWCCTYKLIVPFVMVYTKNLTDVNYNVPVFAALICIAYALYCLRLPFNSMILAAGHYKNTQVIYIVGATMNLVLSVLAVSRWGLVGVTVGTIAAMLYQMIHTGYYVLKHLKVHSLMRTTKQLAFDAVTVLVILYTTSFITAAEVSWMGWIILAVKHAIVIAACIVAMSLLCYRKESMQIVKKLRKKK